MISEHSVTATTLVDGSPTTLSVDDGELTMSERWAPFIQARLELPGVTKEVWDSLDPKQSPVPTVDLQLQQTFGTWNAFTRPDTGFGVELVVRSRRRDRRTGRAEVTLESDEALAQDYRSLEPMPLWINQTDYVDAINQILNFIDAEVAVAPDDTAVDGGLNFTLEPGQTLWDAIEPILQHAGMRLYAEDRVWKLALSPNNLDSVLVIGDAPHDPPIDVVDTDILDTNDDDAYFDAVIIGYTQEDVTTYDTAAVDNPTKTLRLDYQIPYPGAGAAAKILARRLDLGDAPEISAVGNFDTRPGMRLALLKGDTWSVGHVSSVTWYLRDRAMTIRGRGMTAATPTDYPWLNVPHGRAWTDIPSGIPWTNPAWTGIAA